MSSKPAQEDAEGDVGLQLKVSFMDKAIHRNARLAGKWGPAEKNLSFFPFAAGEAFKVLFFVFCFFVKCNVSITGIEKYHYHYFICCR